MALQATPVTTTFPKEAARRLPSLRPLVRNPLTLGGLVIVGLYLVVVAAAPLLAPQDPVAINPGRAMQPPSTELWLGADRFGRDVLSRVIYGTRVSIGVGVGAITLAALIGCTAGLAAGFFGGRTDAVVSRAMDVFFTFPSLILAIVISVTLGTGAQNALFAIAVTYWPSFARVVRASSMAERAKDYVEAARALGVPRLRIIRVHVLPNVLSPIIVQATVGISQAIVIESSLSYLGLGTQPPTPSWGTMINEGRSFLESAPWISIFPGIAIMGAVLGFNLLGDGLRDLLDPRTRPD